MQPVIGILGLQGDVREHARALDASGARAVTVRRPEELDGLDGIVIPGGESTTMGKLLVTFELLEPLRVAVRAGLPAYGSCAGMILLADSVLDGTIGQPTIGGLDVVVRRNAFGRQIDSFEADVQIDGMAGAAVRAVFIRAPAVESVGAGVTVIGRVEAVRHEAAAPHVGRIVAVRQGNLLATAFHPELTGDTRVHRLLVDLARGINSGHGDEEQR
ncbi:MAG: pyridoxal 5-phosphate synthase pdxT subunit [Frankiaceae bacterium]|jgi:5'-phosphate synthase pdxT subunit|nr:pyridoxal 5-phosphate synthase pdxT subunit [Frankiaceae bacterium]